MDRRSRHKCKDILWELVDDDLFLDVRHVRPPRLVFPATVHTRFPDTSKSRPVEAINVGIPVAGTAPISFPRPTGL